MKQPHTEAAIDHTEDQQNTGNHPKPGARESGGADRLGGSREGAPNVEPAAVDRDGPEESIETGTDVDKVSGLDEVNTSTKHSDGRHERHPERDEHGRL